MQKTKIVIILLVIMGSVCFADLEYGEFERDGHIRDYIVYLPTNYEPGLPLVFNLHGYGGWAELQMHLSQMNEVADTANFVVVYPNAIDNKWNSGISDNPGWPTPFVDDVGFLSALIDTIAAHYDIDLDRVFSCGFSNGGRMSFRLAVEISDRLGGVAAIAGKLTNTMVNNCTSTGLLPIMYMYATDDPISPFYEEQEGWYLPEDCVQFWTDLNHCYPDPDSTFLPDLELSDNCSVLAYTYRDSINDADVFFYKILDGGHQWPGGNTLPTQDWGIINMDISASAEIWNFFNSDSFVIESPIWPHSVEIDSTYIQPGLDTLSITAQFHNSENHIFSANAIIQSNDSTVIDSFALSDDGEHDDYGPNDGIWGGYILPQDLEQVFTIHVSNINQGTQEYYLLRDRVHFTTVGPIAFNEITLINDTIVDPGDIINFQFSLENLGSIGIAETITATLNPNDSCFTAVVGSGTFGDILPGQSNSIAGIASFHFSENCTADIDHSISIDVFSNEHHLWTDSIFINDFNVSSTIGPVIFDQITLITDSIAEPGDLINFQFALENLGSIGIAEAITVELSTVDSCVTYLTTAVVPFGDIGPGESVITSSGAGFRITESCPANMDLTIKVDILSYGYHFWTDSFNIHVYEPQVSIADKGLLPQQYSLGQNHPNPFNPVTTIQYQLPQRSDVTITIYDLIGREVATLLSETQDAGFRSIQWDASGAASGMYFYQIKAGEFVQTKKMILLK